jgi:hypothetical protein
MMFLLSLINPIATLLQQLAEAYKAREQAKTDREKIAADERIASLKEQVALAQSAAQHDKWWSTRELIGKCVLIYVFKIVVWDTVLKLDVTPDPGPHVTGIVLLVLGFYYGSRALVDIASRLLVRR